VVYDEDTVRRRIKAERTKRDWKQQQLADRMAEHGHTTWTWTTVAKLEGGSRRLQLGEAAALCDIFGISLEMLSGRRARPVGDLTYAKGLLLDTLRHATRAAAEESGAIDEAIVALMAADPDATCAQLGEQAAEVLTTLRGAMRLAHQIIGQEDTNGRT
jgi:transcriptional regulator with XRE-family HTH domain